VDAEELVQLVNERRLTTLALADQIGDDRWREPALPGGNSIHDVLAHILAWDEWALAVIELSQLRDTLPDTLVQAAADVDAYNAKAMARYRGISRDDIISALQTSAPRLLRSAAANAGPDWPLRRIEGLRGLPGASNPGPGAPPPRAPSVRGILRLLAAHEAQHDDEVMAAFGIEPHLERFKDESGGPPPEE
jgi:DinB superfamily